MHRAVCAALVGELNENLKWEKLPAVTGQNTIVTPVCNEILLEANYNNKRATLHIPYSVIGSSEKTYYIGNSSVSYRVSVSTSRAMLYGASDGITDVIAKATLELCYR